jgi:hypothetical protein
VTASTPSAVTHVFDGHDRLPTCCRIAILGRLLRDIIRIDHRRERITIDASAVVFRRCGPVI